MNKGDEMLEASMNAWLIKETRKIKRKNGIKRTIAFVLLSIIWGYSAYLILRTQVMYSTTDWYEVEAYCTKSAEYEVDSDREEVVNGVRTTVHDTEIRYSNTYVYTAKDGKEYTITSKGATSSQEGFTAPYLVDEENPAHAVPKNGNRLAYAVVLIIAGGMTFCILFTLHMTLQNPPKGF